jgi:hypothetical protein
MRTIISLVEQLRRRLEYALNLRDDEYRGTLGALIIILVLVIATALFAAAVYML